jgi:hypothetical protein
MTDLPTLLFLALFFPVCFLAIRRNSTPLVVGAVAIIGFSSWMRPFGALIWMLPLGLWLARETQQFVRQARQRHSYGQGLKTFAFRSGAALIGSYAAIALITTPLQREGIGLHEKLSLLWVQTIHYNDVMFEQFKRTDRYEAYAKDYRSWVGKGVEPANVDYEPGWRPDPDRAWQSLVEEDGSLSEQGIRWRKVPQWVLMSERGYSLPEAKRWQADVAIDLIVHNPGIFLAQVVREVGEIFVYPPRVERRAMVSVRNSGETGLYTSGVLWVISGVRHINTWMYSTGDSAFGVRPVLYLYALGGLGMMLGYTVYRPWEWTMLIVIVFCHVLATAAIATALPRYRLLLDIYFGTFLVGFFAGLEPLYRRVRGLPDRKDLVTGTTSRPERPERTD